MKFQIWCTVHNCPVIAADNDANLTVTVPRFAVWDGLPIVDDEPEFLIDESNLYCLTAGREHNFEVRI